MRSDYRVDHRISAEDHNIHYAFDRDLDPVRSIKPGAVVRFDCRDVTDGHLTAESTARDVLEKPSNGHPLTGPVEITDAAPGDVLEISFLEFQHKGIGFTYFYPSDANLGLLPNEFDEPGLHIWDLTGETGRFVNGIEVPLDPFPGIVGVAPDEPGEQSTMPPRNVGGNIDVKHLTAGSTLYLPVEVAGGLLSIGDCHAAQGDGEVCVTGIEAPMFVTVHVNLRSDLDIERPQFRTQGPFTPTGEDECMYCTTGIASDLRDASKEAVRGMIDHLSETRNLTRKEAYILCSSIVDLKINEAVNKPNWVVSAYVAESLFPDDPAP